MLFLAFSVLVASAEKLLYTVSTFQYRDEDSGGPWRSQRNISGYVRPFIARKTFQDNFGFEGQKKSWGKNRFLLGRFLWEQILYKNLKFFDNLAVEDFVTLLMGKKSC